MKHLPSALGAVAVEIAREIDQAEAALKATIAQALEGGDATSALRLVRRWSASPASVVLAEIRAERAA